MKKFKQSNNEDVLKQSKNFGWKIIFHDQEQKWENKGSANERKAFINTC